MRPSRIELLFLAAGAGLGLLVAFAGKAGLVAPAAIPPYLIVLVGLGLIELLAGLALKQAPGAMISMPARLGAFVIGVGALALVAGRIT